MVLISIQLFKYLNDTFETPPLIHKSFCWSNRKSLKDNSAQNNLSSLSYSHTYTFTKISSLGMQKCFEALAFSANKYGREYIVRTNYRRWLYCLQCGGVVNATCLIHQRAISALHSKYQHSEKNANTVVNYCNN